MITTGAEEGLQAMAVVGQRVVDISLNERGQVKTLADKVNGEIVESFWKSATGSGKFEVDKRSRLLNVIKTPVNADDFSSCPFAV